MFCSKNAFYFSAFLQKAFFDQIDKAHKTQPLTQKILAKFEIDAFFIAKQQLCKMKCMNSIDKEVEKYFISSHNESNDTNDEDSLLQEITGQKCRVQPFQNNQNQKNCRNYIKENSPVVEHCEELNSQIHRNIMKPCPREPLHKRRLSQPIDDSLPSRLNFVSPKAYDLYVEKSKNQI